MWSLQSVDVSRRFCLVSCSIHTTGAGAKPLRKKNCRFGSNSWPRSSGRHKQTDALLIRHMFTTSKVELSTIEINLACACQLGECDGFLTFAIARNLLESRSQADCWCKVQFFDGIVFAYVGCTRALRELLDSLDLKEVTRFSSFFIPGLHTAGRIPNSKRYQCRYRIMRCWLTLSISNMLQLWPTIAGGDKTCDIQ